MGLAPGSRIGSYEILAVLGEGGMGRVYRARDSKLQRHVAIKVLPDSVAGDAERVARFEREARTLAALNHPHVAQIYGTEQSGDTHALVMELVDGEDLSARIARGPIPWSEAAPIARQIAEALEAAHEQGIIHRDLKPANIKLTPDGVVKVLDFGLAKALDAGAAGAGGAAGAAGLADSPTITSPAAITQGGVILGTAAYMSPEQARGRPADKRSDVWAFGCVLYEMVTGKRAFPGDEVMETLAAVMRAEPDFAALPAGVPREIRTLVERCLVKDRRARVSDIAVARYALETPHTPGVTASPAPTRNLWPWAVGALAAGMAIAAVAIPRFASPAVEPAPVIRSTIPTPGAATVGFATIAVSRQGTSIAYPSTRGRIMLRRLAEADAKPLPGTEGGANPFFSPDGEWLGFFADSKLKKVAVAGGAAQVLADAPSGRGGTWGPDGTIVFAPAPEAGLSIVSGDGGSVTVLTQPTRDERSHRWPHLLPDGRTVLFTIQPAGRIYDDAIIAAVPLSGGVPRVVVEGGSSAQYAESGHLFYGKAGALFAMPFDPVAARATGAAIAVVDNARTNSLNGALPAGVSASGLLVYLPGENTGAAMSLITATRNGPSQVLLDRKLLDSSINLSHDGGRLAFMMVETQADIWILELESRGLRAVTSGAGTENYPVWSPDGSRIYYTTNTGGVTRAVSKAVDGSSPETEVTPNALFPRSLSPDGKLLAGRAITRTSYDVVAVDLANRKTSLLVGSPANESEPAFSPDGRLVAYQSDESGTDEVFVHEFRSGNKWQVTKGGGIQPRWSSGGREIVYRNGSTIFAVPVSVLPFSVAGSAEPVFSAPNLIGFDITADGKRLVAVQQSESTESPHVMLVGGWFEELKARVRPAR